MASADFVELTKDVSTSPLWNADLAPTRLEQRTWSTYSIAALWIGMSVVITTYTLASGLMQQGMTWWQALSTILLGNVIVLVPMVLNAHAGTKYGVSFPVLCRASFGVKGANVPATLRAIVACGWFGIQTWIGGLALDALLAAAWPTWSQVPGGVWIAFFVFWLIQVAIILRGLEGIRLLESWSAPLLLGGGLALLIWAVREGGGLGRILGESARLQQGHTPFWQLFPAALTANVGYWATLSLNIPDFTRYARSQRSQVLGQILGLPTTMTAFAFIGVAVTSATIVLFGEPIWDPVALIARIGNPTVIIVGALVILAAQLTTNMAANVVSPANDFSSLAPRRVSYVMGGLLTAIIGVAMMPWKLYADASAYIFTWLIGYSSLMGAIGGILIADYWILRGRELSLNDLFEVRGRYAYHNGVNRRAIAALVLAIAPVVPGFVRAATTPRGQIANPTFFDALYTYAWFVTFGLSAVIYLVLMRGRDRQPAGSLVETSMRTTKIESSYTLLVTGLFMIGSFFGAACSAPPPEQPAPAPRVTVFEGARLIVGDGSDPIENAAFIVDGARIVGVGRADQLQIPAGAARVNLTGKTVMPAIIDTHTHLAVTREGLIDHLQRKAYYGVGAALSLGQDTGDVPFQVREEIIPNAARYRTAGRGITMPEPGRTEAPYWVTTDAEARKAVQELAARKVDIVKIWVDDRDGKYKKLTPAVYGAIIDEAHKNGLRVTAHIFALEDAKGLMRAGLDAFAHSVRDKDIDAEGLALFGERPSLVVVPNLPDRGVAVDLSWLSDSVPAEELKKLQDAATDRPPLQKAFGIQARNLAKLSAAGVMIALGTDGNVAWAHHLEMADMVAAGMTPAQVIEAATQNAAAFLRLSDAGTVETGKSADFLVLDANPLDDITNTRRIADVYLRGALVDRAAMRARWMKQTPTTTQ
jgi:NCS1 family nucleobase:cation symporter-1